MSIRWLIILIAFVGPTWAWAADEDWPQFRGAGASGVSPTMAPVKWDVKEGKSIRWKTPIAGLGHASPVVWGERVYLTTAVPDDGGGDQRLKTGLYGDIEPVEEKAEYRWLVLCFDKATGKQIWEREAHRGTPKVKRHPKATHANSTVATDGQRVIAFFGSEGLHCFDTMGKPLWQKDFGVLDSGFFVAPDAQWGFASSPVLFEDKVIVQADVQKNSFVAVLDANSGEELWRTPRNDVPSWSTPAVHRFAERTQVLVNGYKEIAGYDLATGKRIWMLNGGGDVPVPTPIVAHDLIFITGAHGPLAPIYAIKPTAEGDISLPRGGKHMAWSILRGGNYMQTPIVVGDLLYACRDNGLLTCFDAKTGKQLFRQRLDGNGFTASPVAAGDRLYFTSEDGRVHVIKAGPTFESLAENELGEPCLATPALSGGTIFFRTRGHLIAVGGE